MKLILFVIGLLVLCIVLTNERFVFAQKKESELSKFPQDVIRFTNEARKKNKLPPLKGNKLLMKAAQEHSVNMAKQQKLSHKLDGKGPDNRILKAGYKYLVVGENISKGTYTAKQVVDGWLESKFHRSNILEKDFTEIGIGRAKSKDGNYYYTQVFATPYPRR